MERNIATGKFITVKPSHAMDLGGDPPYGLVIAMPRPTKLRVLWCNGRISSHAVDSPYMDRFTTARSY